MIRIEGIPIVAARLAAEAEIHEDSREPLHGPDDSGFGQACLPVPQQPSGPAGSRANAQNCA